MRKYEKSKENRRNHEKIKNSVDLLNNLCEIFEIRPTLSTPTEAESLPLPYIYELCFRYTKEMLMGLRIRAEVLKFFLERGQTREMQKRL